MEVWTDSEKTETFLHCLKAEKICAEVRKVYNICRASPFGRVIDPSLCGIHAKNLIDCFEEARDMYPPCQYEFQTARDCIAKAKQEWVSVTSCEEETKKYENCFHPSLSKYEGYENKYRKSSHE